MERTLKNKKVLVTGGSGYIGKHLIKRLLCEEAVIYALGLSEINDSNVNFVKCDICNKTEVQKIVSSIEPHAIFHLAAYGVKNYANDIFQAIDVNIKGTINLIDALKDNSNFELFINTGSEFEYGNKTATISEETMLQPLTEYSSTKAAATLISMQYAHSLKIPIVTLRLFSIYGGHENRSRFIPYIINSILHEEEVKLTGCEQIRDYVYIDDILDAYICAYKYFDKNNEIINISTDTPITLKSILEQIQNIIGKKGNVKIGAIPYRENEMWKIVGDNAKAKELIKWLPKTNLAEGLNHTINFYRRNDNFED